MLQAATVEEAVAALSRSSARALAGGTDLIPAMGRGEIKPRLLVNLKPIPELAGIRPVRGAVRIGALTLVADVERSVMVQERLPLLAEAARDFGSIQIRNLATIGGNVCNAAPSADFAAALLALDARLEIRGPKGGRELDLESFFRDAGRTALRRGEVLTALLVPRPRVRTGAAHEKLGIRRAMDLALVLAAAAVHLAPDRCKCRRVRIALGSVAPAPMRARKAEEVLEGKAVTPEAIDAAARAGAAEARPISDLRASAEYRRDMTRVLIRRVLTEAARRARAEQRE
jgi:carbon-monoxide dehydrogenase medium subunit